MVSHDPNRGPRRGVGGGIRHGSMGPRWAGNKGGGGVGLGVNRNDQRRGGGGIGSKSNRKQPTLGNQIRSVERLLKRSPPHEVKVAMEKKLAELKEQLAARARNALEQKMTLRYKRVKFLERREIERRMRRVEKQQRMLAERGEDKGEAAAELAKQMSQLKLDMEYVRFFPKSEKYVSLFKGDDSEHVVARRQALREMIRANLAAAAAEGVDLEISGSEDDTMNDVTDDDDFFKENKSGGDADADDEWDDKSPADRDDRDDTSREAVPLSLGRPFVDAGHNRKMRPPTSTSETSLSSKRKSHHSVERPGSKGRGDGGQKRFQAGAAGHGASSSGHTSQGRRSGDIVNGERASGSAGVRNLANPVSVEDGKKRRKRKRANKKGKRG